MAGPKRAAYFLQYLFGKSQLTMNTDGGVDLFSQQSHLSIHEWQGLARQELASTLQTQYDLQAVSSQYSLLDPSSPGFEQLEVLHARAQPVAHPRHKPTDNDFDQLFVALTDSVITWSDFGVWKDLGRVIVVNHDKARSRGILRGPLARPPPLRNGASQPMVRLSLRQYWPNAMSLQRGKR